MSCKKQMPLIVSVLGTKVKPSVSKKCLDAAKKSGARSLRFQLGRKRRTRPDKRPGAPSRTHHTPGCVDAGTAQEAMPSKTVAAVVNRRTCRADWLILSLAV